MGQSLPTLPIGPGSSVAIGAIAGVVSTISHSAGPIVMLYLLQERIDKKRLVGTMLMFTLLINGVKVVCYGVIGAVTWATFQQTWWMIPFLPVGTLAGVWMNRRIPEKPFTVVMYLAAGATAAQMIYKALA